MEIARERIKEENIADKVMRVLQKYTKPAQIPANQNQIVGARTRFKVTTCLYLNPNNNARSLSTLMAVDVKTETLHKM